jgi:hypothetical protein
MTTTMPTELRVIANRFHNAHADATTALARAQQRWTERDPQLAERTQASRAKADELYDELTKPKPNPADGNAAQEEEPWFDEDPLGIRRT